MLSWLKHKICWMLVQNDCNILIKLFQQMYQNLIGVLAILTWSSVWSIILFGSLWLAGLLRVSEEEEIQGYILPICSFLSNQTNCVADSTNLFKKCIYLFLIQLSKDPVWFRSIIFYKVLLQKECLTLCVRWELLTVGYIVKTQQISSFLKTIAAR